MKRALVLSAALLSLSGLPAVADSNGKILVIVKDNSIAMDLMLNQEIGAMSYFLEEAGYIPVFATSSGEALKGQQSELQPDLKLADVDISDYVGVLVPCMAMGLGMGRGITEDAVRLIRRADALNIPIAAQGGGVEILARAGVLDHRHFSCYKRNIKAGTSSIYDGLGISQDSIIITSGTCPYCATAEAADRTADLAKQLIFTVRTLQYSKLNP
jgi:putative intracellular protease/amidase